MKRKVIGILIIVTILIAISIGFAGGNNELVEEVEEEIYVPVEVKQVNYTDLANITTMSGNVFADKDLMILPTMPGKVKSINFKDGDQVKKGDVLFTLDGKDIQKQIDQAKIAYDMAKVNYNMGEDQAKVTQDTYERTKALTESVLDNARENLENTKKLYEVGAVSKIQLEQAEISLQQQETQMEGQLDQAEMSSSDKINQLSSIQLKQAELAYKQARDGLDNTVITSPIDGIVTGRTIEVGTIASNAQASMNIVDMNNVYVEIQVVDGLINKLSQGQKVSLIIPAISPEYRDVVIDSVNSIPDPRTQLYSIKINIENNDGKIKPGMFANVEIPLEEKINVLSIPSESVIIKNEKNLVYILEDEKAVEREIKIGLDTGSEVEVLEGLKENDIVIIKGHNYVKDGGIVKVVGGMDR